MAESANIIQACAAKLKSANASFQQKVRPFHATPTNFSPSLFFSGSKGDLKHVLQLCSNKAPFSAVVDISLYSLTLSSNDLDWLSERIAEYNNQQVIGHFLYEDKVGKMQIRFVVRLHLDKRKLNDWDYLGKATWEAITSADKHYRAIGGKFLEDLRVKESAPKELDSLVHRIVRMDLMKRNLKFELRNIDSVPKFIFNLTIPGLSAPFGVSQCTLAATEEVLTLRSVLCFEGQAAVFQNSASYFLRKQANLLNVKMMICHLVIKEMTVTMVHHMHLLGLPKDKLESAISYNISAFSKQLERVFPRFEHFYTDTSSNLEMKEELGHFEKKELYRDYLSDEELHKEELEKEKIVSRQSSAQFFYYEGLSMEGPYAVIKIPYLFKEITAMIQGKIVVPESFAFALCAMLQEFVKDKLFYRNLETLIYLTGEIFLQVSGICELEVVPRKLSTMHPDDPSYNGTYSGLLGCLNINQLKMLFKFFERRKMNEFESLMSYVHGARIDFSAVKCEQKPCVHGRTNTHKIGRTKVRLTRVFECGMYRDLYEIMKQYFMSVKCYHDRYQRRPLGVTIEEKEVDSCLFLVEEEAKYPSLTSFFISEGHSFPRAQIGQKLYSDISQAVDHLHSKGVSQLLLCPSTIAVDVISRAGRECEVRAKLDAVPAITPDNYKEVIAYTHLDALQNPENYDWKEGDKHSLSLLEKYLINEDAPSQQDVELNCTMPVLRGTQMLTNVLRKIRR